MRIHNCGYLIKSGFKGVFANRNMAFASVGSLTACFLLIGVASLLAYAVNSMVEDIGRANEIIVYLVDGLEEEETHGVYYTLMEIGNVDSAEYYNAEDNLAAMSEKLGEAPDTLLLEVSDNPFLASYQVRIKDPEEYDNTYTQISSLDGVFAVKGSPEVATILIDFRRTIVIASSGVIVLLTVVSMLIVSNTIKMTVFNRRKEINIMKFVGATDHFIRTPFLIEGIILGCIAALLAVPKHIKARTTSYHSVVSTRLCRNSI